MKVPHNDCNDVSVVINPEFKKLDRVALKFDQVHQAYKVFRFLYIIYSCESMKNIVTV